MPIYEYRCITCGEVYEKISSVHSDKEVCPSCGSPETEKLISSTSSLTGKETPTVPDSAGTGCCGSNPHSKGCVPGSCCGKA